MTECIWLIYPLLGILTYTCAPSLMVGVFMCVCLCACVIYRRITSNSSSGYVVNTPKRDKREREGEVCVAMRHTASNRSS